jgi:hypothetical protein
VVDSHFISNSERFNFRCSQSYKHIYTNRYSDDASRCDRRDKKGCFAERYRPTSTCSSRMPCVSAWPQHSDAAGAHSTTCDCPSLCRLQRQRAPLTLLDAAVKCGDRLGRRLRGDLNSRRPEPRRTTSAAPTSAALPADPGPLNSASYSSQEPTPKFAACPSWGRSEADVTCEEAAHSKRACTR